MINARKLIKLDGYALQNPIVRIATLAIAVEFDQNPTARGCGSMVERKLPKL